MKELVILSATELSVGTDQQFDLAIPDFARYRRVDYYVLRTAGSGTLANISFQPLSADGTAMYGTTSFQSQSTSQGRHWDAPQAPIMRIELDVATAAATVKIVAIGID
ncbi:MAG: hypothetical protein Unbinned767contig1000_15 [Prokaryotic dsDNA virus sp.]|nr:MAG: hypothetical protein Unbinned767contig1000_15 [Prokaryotic dsDNA virus sp.]|tara:strand:- start:5859 stop:6182 length:324 start_codon:yes stop_codon:yes gene_type:complete